MDIFEGENIYLDNFHLNAWFQLGELKINGDWELAANWTKSALKESRIVLMEFRHCPPHQTPAFPKRMIFQKISKGWGECHHLSRIYFAGFPLY